MDVPCACRPLVVLIADDEPLIRSLLTIWLKKRGFVALAASSGDEAVELLRTHQEVALALIDLRMPGMGGLATVAALRALRPGLPCCLMGGDLEVEPGSGAGVVLHKPFSVDELAEVLGRLLAVDG